MYGIYDGSKVIAKFTVPMSWKSNVPVFAADALSLRRLTAKRAAQRWELTTNLEPLRESANELFSLLVDKGNWAPIQIIVPQNFGAKKNLTNTNSNVLATGTSGNSNITISSANGKIPVGTMVRFLNHSKLYMIKSTVETSGNTTSATLHPNLIANVTSEQMFHKDNLVANMIMDTDFIPGMVYDDGILMEIKNITLLEAL